MSTNAYKFSSLFGHDGQTWETDDGQTFKQIASDLGATTEYSAREYDDDGELHYVSGYEGGHFSSDPVRYIFPDGSVIVAAGDAWGFEGNTHFSWEY